MNGFLSGIGFHITVKFPIINNYIHLSCVFNCTSDSYNTLSDKIEALPDVQQTLNDFVRHHTNVFTDELYYVPFTLVFDLTQKHREEFIKNEEEFQKEHILQEFSSQRVCAKDINKYIIAKLYNLNMTNEDFIYGSEVLKQYNIRRKFSPEKK
jgi:hypothetical protein